jgi:glycine betaine/proline transport system substrate-binding protein
MKKRLLTSIAVTAAAAIALAGCSSSGSSKGSSDDSKGDITIGVFSGWAEGEAASYVWQQVLEDKGYNVKLETADAGPLFAALSKGQYDATFDVWLPGTHASYWKKYGKDLDDLGAWYDSAPLTIAVNKDAPIDSLDQLAAHADEFDNTLVGIEPGAGETGIVQDKVIKAYGLEGMDFQTSSTAAMLAQLKKSINEKKNIAVTLWQPHWAYSAFPLKDLKDPKGALGDPDHIDTVVRKGFSDDDAEVSKWFENFHFDPALLSDLENKMFNSGADESEYPSIVKKWLSSHKDFEDGLTS